LFNVAKGSLYFVIEASLSQATFAGEMAIKPLNTHAKCVNVLFG